MAKVKFSDNPDRIPAPWATDVEEGITQALNATRPAGEEWLAVHRATQGDEISVAFSRGNKPVGTLKMSEIDIHTRPGHEAESAKVQAAVKGAVEDFLAASEHI
jgi:hypothetical protein